MMKRLGWKTWLAVAALLVSMPVVGFFYFIFANEAPIVTGEVIYNQEYKPGLSLDIYAPIKNVFEQTPVVMFIHGGAWIGGTKEALNMNRFNKATNTLRKAGYAIVSINYTLARPSRSPFPHCIADAADAVMWIQNHAEEFNFDPNNIGLFGESAGAHIAMMLAYGDASLYSSSYVPTEFTYVVDVYGPSYLEGLYTMPTADTIYSLVRELPEPLKSQLDVARYLFGFDPRKDSLRAAEFMAEFSPLNYLGNEAPPTLMIQGDRDLLVPKEQTLRLAQKLDSLGREHELHLLAGMNHSFMDATPKQKHDAQQWIIDFVMKHYCIH